MFRLSRDRDNQVHFGLLFAFPANHHHSIQEKKNTSSYTPHIPFCFTFLDRRMIQKCCSILLRITNNSLYYSSTPSRRRKQRLMMLMTTRSLLLGVVLAFSVFTTATDSFSTTTTVTARQSRTEQHALPKLPQLQLQRRRPKGSPLFASTAIPLQHTTNHNHHSNKKNNNINTILATATATTSATITNSKKTNQKKLQPQHSLLLSSSTTTSITAASSSSVKDVWAERYCSVQGLRDAFGRNRNRLWGDLDGPTTRRLYKRLLPVILLELRDQYNATELAPLAYRARLAAKLYSRERSIIPARLAAHGLDLVRHFWKYREFNHKGMSYQQVFEKYAQTCQTTNEQEVCAKILERSCVSNETIDRWLLSRTTTNPTNDHDNHHDHQQQHHHQHQQYQWKELEEISWLCEQDIRQLLQLTESLQNFRALRSIAKVKRRIALIQKSFRFSKTTTKPQSSSSSSQSTTTLTMNHRSHQQQ